MPSLPEDALRGSSPPLVTPFCNATVDSAHARLIEFRIAESGYGSGQGGGHGGGHGVPVDGTPSEPASLTVDQRNRLVDVAAEAAARRAAIGRAGRA